MKVMACAMAALVAGRATHVHAQTPNAAQSAPAPVLTHLHLSVEGSVSVPPDELVADLVVQARATSPAAAQGKLTVLMKLGMQQATSFTSMTARATGYSVQQVDRDAPVTSVVRTSPEKPGWEAQQILELRASSGTQLFELVGKLQG
jgi:predicted secreted protein